MLFPQSAVHVLNYGMRESLLHASLAEDGHLYELQQALHDDGVLMCFDRAHILACLNVGLAAWPRCACSQPHHDGCPFKSQQALCKAGADGLGICLADITLYGGEKSTRALGLPEAPSPKHEYGTLALTLELVDSMDEVRTACFCSESAH